MGILLAAILLIILSIGGTFYMDQKQFQNEMISVVKSEEAKQIFENSLKDLDSQALTPNGKIKSYEIDYGSVTHNPMGGIMIKLIVNKNGNFYVRITLSKYSEKLEESGGSVSADLIEFLDKEG